MDAFSSSAEQFMPTIEQSFLAAKAAGLAMNREIVEILPPALRPTSAKAQDNGSVVLNFTEAQGARAFQEGLLAVCGQKSCHKRDIICGPRAMFNISGDGLTLTVHQPQTLITALEGLGVHPVSAQSGLFRRAAVNAHNAEQGITP